MELRAADVAERLGLAPEYGNWLESLEKVEVTPGAVRVPEAAEAVEVLRRLGLEPADVEGVLAAWAALRQLPEMCWLLERTAQGVRARVGDVEAVPPMPSLPVSHGAGARCFWVFAYMAALDDIRAWHRAQGISDEVSWDTLSDLGRHVRLYRQRNGVTGLDTPWWITLHFQGSLYALGRLQFQLYRLTSGPAGPLFWYDDEPLREGFRHGDRALGLHIPESGPLTPAACDDSFNQATAFFRQHFQPFAGAVVTCTSWLLDDQLEEYLPPESNIIQFQRRFELVPGALDSDSSAFHFVFGRRVEAINDITPRTTLERAMVDHVRAGKHWRLRTGWLRLPS